MENRYVARQAPNRFWGICLDTWTGDVMKDGRLFSSQTCLHAVKDEATAEAIAGLMNRLHVTPFDMGFPCDRCVSLKRESFCAAHRCPHLARCRKGAYQVIGMMRRILKGESCEVFEAERSEAVPREGPRSGA